MVSPKFKDSQGFSFRRIEESVPEGADGNREGRARNGQGTL
jgi:hypothetical protein